MLSKTKRLKIQKVADQKPQKIKRGKFFLIKTFSSPSPTPQIGIAIGKKVFPAATKRNRLKRVVANHVREIYIHLPGQDYLIQALPPAATAPDRAIIEELRALLLT